jgi:hypothetical protein
MDPCLECAKLRQDNMALKSEIALLKGGIDYLEKSKVPWLEGRIAELLASRKI